MTETTVPTINSLYQYTQLNVLRRNTRTKNSEWPAGSWQRIATDHVDVQSPMIGQYKLDLWVNSIRDTGPHNSVCGPGPGRVCTTAAGPGRAWASNRICRPGLGLNFRPVQGPSAYRFLRTMWIRHQPLLTPQPGRCISPLGSSATATHRADDRCASNVYWRTWTCTCTANAAARTTVPDRMKNFAWRESTTNTGSSSRSRTANAKITSRRKCGRSCRGS